MVATPHPNNLHMMEPFSDLQRLSSIGDEPQHLVGSDRYLDSTELATYREGVTD